MNVTEAELKIVLEKHALWLRNNPNGTRADLRDADLCDADLGGADLRGADLRGADLSDANLRDASLGGANLCGANLCGANLYKADLGGADVRYANLRDASLYGVNLGWASLYGADLRYSDLRYADLRDADIRGANLRGADLRDADLRGADLDEAVNVNVPLMCPEKGSFTGFKKVRGNYIVELEILADAMRSSATGRKCRCSKAKVVSITNPDGSKAEETSACSGCDPNFIYSVGKIVEVFNFDTNRWNECAPGIHFFITRQEAIDYVLYRRLENEYRQRDSLRSESGWNIHGYVRKQSSTC